MLKTILTASLLAAGWHSRLPRQPLRPSLLHKPSCLHQPLTSRRRRGTGITISAAVFSSAFPFMGTLTAVAAVGCAIERLRPEAAIGGTATTHAGTAGD
jgi:hypothetical protein